MMTNSEELGMRDQIVGLLKEKAVMKRLMHLKM
jgi:hypothetical protein